MSQFETVQIGRLLMREIEMCEIKYARIIELRKFQHTNCGRVFDSNTLEKIFCDWN